MCIANGIGIANASQEPRIEVVVLTPELRLQAQMLAALNSDRASVCGLGQEALRETFVMNANFLNAIAGVQS